MILESKLTKMVKLKPALEGSIDKLNKLTRIPKSHDDCEESVQDKLNRIYDSEDTSSKLKKKPMRVCSQQEDPDIDRCLWPAETEEELDENMIKSAKANAGTEEYGKAAIELLKQTIVKQQKQID